MSRNGSGVYSLPAGSTVANGDTSDATDLNTPLADIEADLNLARPIVAGGTGATSATAARAALGLEIGTDVQAYDAYLQSASGLTYAADKILGSSAADTAALFDKPAGDIAGTTATQTLTNKTLTAPVINSPITGDVVLSEATWTTGTDTTEAVVSPAKVKAAVDTLAPTTVSTATTSGTAIEFNSIPSGAYDIRMGFVGVSLSGTDEILIQLSTGSTFVTTGYVNNKWRINGSSPLEAASTTGFAYSTGQASYENWGVTDFLKAPGANSWVVQGQIANGTLAYGTSGGITLAGELDGIRITTSGTDTFDAGSVFISYKVA